MNFKKGFEKTAVSVKWVADKVGRGMANITGKFQNMPVKKAIPAAKDYVSRSMSIKDSRGFMDKAKDVAKQIKDPTGASTRLRDISPGGRQLIKDTVSAMRGKG